MAKAQRSRKDLKPIEDKLREEREDLLRQITDFEERYSGQEPKGEGEGEPETVTLERERDQSLLDNAQDLLDQVDRALSKIEGGTYGVCASCGKSIEAARLKALPHASLCISCKRLDERR